MNTEVGNGLVEKLRGLSSRQRQAMLQLMKKEGMDTSELELIIPKDARGPSPLSYQQQSVWFLAKFQGNNAHYNISQAFRLSGNLDREAIIKGVETVVARHDVLRTRYAVTDDFPEQVVGDANDFKVSVERISPDEDIESVLRREEATPFSFDTDYMIRIRLLVLSEEEHILVITVHHSVFDGWSMRVFYTELFSLYDAFCTGQDNPFPPLPLQYSDYARWQKDWLSSEAAQAQLNYWCKELDGTSLLLLPADKRRPQRQTFNGSREKRLFSTPLLEKLKAVSASHGATLYMTLLAAFNILLNQYTNRADIAIGSPVANRNQPVLEKLIGFFANILVMRTDMSGDLNFARLLERVKKVTLGAYANQDIPFEYVVDALNPDRKMDYAPLFQIVFTLQSQAMKELVCQEVTISPIDYAINFAKQDLLVVLTEGDRGLGIAIDYNRDIFEKATIQQFIKQYERILNEVARNPDIKISDIDILTDEEKDRIVNSWNDTSTAYPRDKSIHHLFKEVAAGRAEEIALSCQGKELTYRELDEKTDRLAHTLLDEGVIPGNLIGICFDRSVEMVVGILAILKAGCAYVPIDANYPVDRIAFILRDSGIKILLTARKFVDRLPLTGQGIMYLDDFEEGQPSAMPVREAKVLPEVSPRHLAYVMYTSGTTGHPKGVQVEHRNVIRLVRNNSFLTLDQSVVTLLQSPVTFDASTFELWAPLLNGGKLVVYTGASTDLSGMARTVQEQQVNTLWLTAALLDPWVDAYNPEHSTLKTLLAGGDVVPAKPVQELYRRFPRLRIINGYGPTENTTFSCCYTIPRELGQSENIPIGKPISQSTAYILNESMRPLPVGGIGELFVGGDGVARGYLNQPELTEKKFLKNPFSWNPAERMYRTGDLARWRSDGNIEFIGRVDNQVKIRGFRVEPGEVEALLSRHDMVQSCAVVVQEDNAGEKVIVVYLVPAIAGNKGDAEALQAILSDYLAQSLPEFMIPAGIVVMESLPLTPNGKLDRRALPKFSRENHLKHGQSAPRTEVEKVIAEIWKNVLGLEDISVHDNFFDLGGNSIQAIKVSGRIQKALSGEVSVTDIFQYSTIELLARKLCEGLQLEPTRAHVLTLREGSELPLFMIHHVLGDASVYFPLSRLLKEGIPVYGLQPFELSAEQLADVTYEELATYHIKAMKEIQPEGPYRMAGHSGGGYLAYEIARQLLEEGRQVEYLGMIDTHNSGNEELPQDAVDVEHHKSTALLLSIIQAYNAEKYEQAIKDVRKLENNNMRDLYDYCKEKDFLPPKFSFDDVMDQLNLTSPLVRATNRYKPVELPIKVHLIGAEESIKNDETLGWGSFISNAWKLDVISGDHGSIFHPPNLELLAQCISTAMADSDSQDRRQSKN